MADLRERLQSGLADRYRIERELGRGGMATVFLALDLRHKRLVALKVLHPELAASLGPERFQHEIETVARLYLLLDEPAKALDQLEPLLQVPYYLSPGWLRIDPTFAPLRGNPRFERLVNGP